MSPYSIAIALSLLSQGARGATFDEIKDGLHLCGDKNAIASEFIAWKTELLECTEFDDDRYGEPVVWQLANKIYVDTGYELKPEFKKSAGKRFNSEVELLNFDDKVSAAAKINRQDQQRNQENNHVK